jgi:protein phosphatase
MLVKPALNLFVVADGMGGHNAGEVASTLAALSLENCYAAGMEGALPAELAADPRPLSADARRLVAAVRKANADVWEIASTHDEHKGMGTTVVASCVSLDDGEFHVAHVGDSRCYRIRNGEIQQLTRDHSLISDALAFKPDLTEEQLAMFPKNVISRALGRAATVEIDLRSEALAKGDTFVLCSDGLSGMVNDPAILSLVQGAKSLEAAADALISAANEGGGTDNVTAVLVRID